MYALGIDLGTTYTAAATWRDDRVEIASLGSRAAVIPSVVLLRDDETFLTGETANRRALTEPSRVAREFKRRLGDPTPLLLGGVPYSAEGLMGRLLRWVVDEVSAREGGEPSSICVSHPANWGPYKLDLLQQAVRRAGLEIPVCYTTEPAAAATFYAQGRPVASGSVVAVYDLGGGTFDAAVLRKTGTGFELLGQPEGIERLGGIDFDAAVFSHVSRAIGGKLEELDESDPQALAAVARLREECVEAKEALSTDTDVSIPVLLPNLNTEVRLTRSEFEGMVRPVLHESIEALRRALRSASVEPEDLHAVLLVGGSSRIPLISQLVGAELGRPVAVDAHPKHAIALGAAWVASGVAPAAVEDSEPLAETADPPSGDGRGIGAALAGGVTGGVAGGVAAGAALAGAAASSRDADEETPAEPIHDEPLNERTVIMPRAFSEGQGGQPERPTVPSRARAEDSQAHEVYESHRGYTAGQGGGGQGRGQQRPLLVAGAVAIAVGFGFGGWLLFGQDDNNGDPPAGANDGQQQQDDAQPDDAPPDDAQPDDAQPDDAQPDDAQPDDGQDESDPEDDDVEGGAELAADEQCSEEVTANERWVCITSAALVEGQFVIEYDAEWAGEAPSIDGGFHVHFYGADESGTNPPDSIMGTHAEGPGSWYVEDQNPSIHPLGSSQAETLGDAPKVCARVANGSHELVSDANGGFNTGNCWPWQS